MTVALLSLEGGEVRLEGGELFPRLLQLGLGLRRLSLRRLSLRRLSHLRWRQFPRPSVRFHSRRFSPFASR